MSIPETVTWISFNPALSPKSRVRAALLDIIKDLKQFSKEEITTDKQVELERRRSVIIESCDRNIPDYRKFVAAINLLIDLLKQGWQLRSYGKDIKIGRPDYLKSEEDSRNYIRLQLHAERNEQLREESVQAFIRSMEARRCYKDNMVSIFDLIRDGRELAGKISSVCSINDEHKQVHKLGEIVKPYIQFVTGEDKCGLTGFRLVDIWRYFRHTWANPYKSVPGRTVMVLVRDEATPYHAVMGIAALSSATVGNTVRDNWLGWTSENIYGRLVSLLDGNEKEISVKYIPWMHEVFEHGIKDVYLTDLMSEKLLTKKDLVSPTAEVVKRLLLLSKNDRVKYYALAQRGDNLKAENSAKVNDDYWEKQAKTLLFRSKRELEIANLLSIRIVLDKYFKKQINDEAIKKFIRSKEGCETVSKIVRKAKAERVGNLIADLAVCGALPPYNEILGAKLVAMLLTSPKVINDYGKRYGKQPSIIASSVAGRSIVRDSNLAFITTTSLYGQRPNQYDRLKVPCHELIEENKFTIEYKYLGQTEGIGTFHFSNKTMHSLESLVSGESVQKVNSVFGEGANPRMRKIRDGLTVLGVAAEEILMHGTPRIIYGVQLIENLTDYLLGISKRPKYYLRRDVRIEKEAEKKIVEWWLRRWAVKRINRQDIVDKIAQHTLVRPIRHGARVVLPRMDISQNLLFDTCAQ